MNDSELKKRLSTLQVPSEDESARGRALHRANLALGKTPVEKAIPQGRKLLALLACTTLAVALLCLLYPRAGTTPATDSRSMAQARGVLQQMEVLFPGQIDAVIDMDGKVDLELVSGTPQPSDQPLIVKLRSGDKAIQILSYSGRKICLDLNGSKTCFEALISSEGNVILVGEDFVWTSQSPSSLAGYRIEASQLTPAS